MEGICFLGTRIISHKISQEGTMSTGLYGNIVCGFSWLIFSPIYIDGPYSRGLQRGNGHANHYRGTSYRAKTKRSRRFKLPSPTSSQLRKFVYAKLCMAATPASRGISPSAVQIQEKLELEAFGTYGYRILQLKHWHVGNSKTTKIYFCVFFKCQIYANHTNIAAMNYKHIYHRARNMEFWCTSILLSCHRRPKFGEGVARGRRVSAGICGGKIPTSQGRQGLGCCLDIHFI